MIKRPLKMRPASFVLAACGPGTFIVNRNDYGIDERGDGFGVGHQLLTTSHYDPQEIEVVLPLLSLRHQLHGGPILAVDCGANIGVHSVEWAKFMHEWGHVLAFEAQERLYYALAGNIALNNCFNVTAMHAAVGARPGRIRVPWVNYHTPSSFGSLELRKRKANENIGQKIDYARGNQVQQVSLDSLNLHRLDFLKIDVEGMELEVLRGAKDSIRRFRPVMLIETIKVGQAKLERMLGRLGYDFTQLGVNLMAIHKSDPVYGQVREKTEKG